MARTSGGLKIPVNLVGRDVVERRSEYWRWLREEAPVHRGRIAVVPVWLVSRYDDCVLVLKDERFGRDRARITGGSKLPFPMPRSVRVLSENLLLADEPQHTRLRGLVQKAFTTHAIEGMEPELVAHAHALLDDAFRDGGRIDLQAAYAKPLPARAIMHMLGIPDDDAPKFHTVLSAVSTGFGPLTLLRTLLRDMPRSIRDIRALIAWKRTHPGDDILSRLVAAEEDGDRLSEEELVTMVFLLIMAGFETTLHLIGNLVRALVEHPEQLALLREDPSRIPDAVEEGLRWCGPIGGTKPNYTREDVELHGVTIPRHAMVIPALGAANRDPAVFDDPERFDVTRTPNRHLGFGRGVHFCLGAPLARMETRVALEVLLERVGEFRLAPEAATQQPAAVPMWVRYPSLPIELVPARRSLGATVVGHA